MLKYSEPTVDLTHKAPLTLLGDQVQNSLIRTGEIKFVVSLQGVRGAHKNNDGRLN